MKYLLFVLCTLIIACKDKDKDVTPVGKPMEGVFRVPNNGNVKFTFTNIGDSTKARVTYYEETILFTAYKSRRIDEIVFIPGDRTSTLTTWVEGDNTNVTFKIYNNKNGKSLFGYSGQLKRIE